MKFNSNQESRPLMVSPYLERRLRSYREALREIRRRHAARRARKAQDRGHRSKSGHLRLVPSDRKHQSSDKPGKGA